jgi:hypothetical protein
MAATLLANPHVALNLGLLYGVGLCSYLYFVVMPRCPLREHWLSRLALSAPALAGLFLAPFLFFPEPLITPEHSDFVRSLPLFASLIDSFFSSTQFSCRLSALPFPGCFCGRRFSKYDPSSGNSDPELTLILCIWLCAGVCMGCGVRSGGARRGV